MPPVQISRRAVSALPVEHKTGAAVALVKQAQATVGPIQLWGATKNARGTTISFAVTGTKHAIGNALIVKTALSIAELSGFSDCAVLVSSIGDSESKKRFTRELTNFFKKQHDAIPHDVKARASHDPDGVYRELLNRKDPFIERAPRAIDYLSENSRKLMLETLSFFESVGISYALDPRLHGEVGVHGELVFAIEATDKDGARVRIATGGRFDNEVKKNWGVQSESATAISISVPKSMRVDERDDAPQCFVVHVGDAAKLKAFTLLEALWRAHISVTQAFLSDNFREQIDKGKLSGTKYLAIIGQREALDKTILVRNTATQMQVTLPLDKFEGYVSRAHR
jgi:histidyl-tRNA synthetase